MGDQVKMSSLGWTVIQYNWFPYNNGTLDRDRHVWRESHVMRQDEGDDAKDRGWCNASSSQGAPEATRSSFSRAFRGSLTSLTS